MKIVIRELQTSRYHKIKSVVSYLVMLGSLLLLIASKRSVKSFQITYLIGLEMNYSAQILMMSATKVEFFLVRESRSSLLYSIKSWVKYMTFYLIHPHSTSSLAQLMHCSSGPLSSETFLMKIINSDVSYFSYIMPRSLSHLNEDFIE